MVLSDTDGNDLMAIGKAFAHNRNIEVSILDLSNNNITKGIPLGLAFRLLSVGVEAFAEGLSAMKHGLQVLNLRNCGISAKSMLVFIDQMKKNLYHVAALEELDLSGNTFGMQLGTSSIQLTSELR